MILIRGVAVAALGLSAVSGVSAQGITAVRPLSGYMCMMLNLTEQQSMDPSVSIPVRSRPSDTAPVVGSAPATIAVREPPKPINGYLEALFPTGQRVWIAANSVRPYHSLGDPTAKCIPAVMSNGKPGFLHPH